jgi:hypothetical protein
MAARQGSKHHAAKMTEAKVRAARKAFANPTFIVVDGKRQPVNTATLARKYGISHQAMRNILSGQTWGHVR